jgi:PAS domain S-box-containing protein
MRRRALQYTIGLAVVGVLLTLFVMYVERSTLRTYDHNLPYIALGDQIKARTTQAHLALEELIGGDASLNFDRDVATRLTSARDLLQAAYDGKESELGKFHPLQDEESKALIKETLIAVEKLIPAAQERWNNKPKPAPVVRDSTGAIISAPVADESQIEDQKFDNLFDASQTSIDRLTTHFNTNIKSKHEFANYSSWFSILLIAVAFVALTVLLYRLQSRTEIIEAANAQQLDEREKAVSSLSNFIEAISAGNYEVELTSIGDVNFTNTLLKMRDKLRVNAEDDRKRNWSTSGLAQIGEILRANNLSTEELYDNIIRFVVKYTRSNQGGLFILNEDNESDKYLELMACYAFERKKYLKKKLAAGEGLVGQCYLEGARIYLKEVPQEYITITSGLGGANPNALLLVPLRVNERIYGVLELATFGEYKDFEVELVEKLAETIASTISTVRVNQSTKELLEKTQQQAEEMRAQEEEMRQNMEELEATQEEMRRKEKHIQQMLETEKQRNEFNKNSRKAIMELSKHADILNGNWDKALERITKAITKHLEASRASIWRIDEQQDILHCEKLYRGHTGVAEKIADLQGRQYPSFWKAVRSDDAIMAKDAYSNGATRELAEAYLRPDDIQSVLTVPYYHEGKIAGVIICEQQHEQREWNDDHVEFLKSLADLVTVTQNTSKINLMLKEVSDAQETMQIIIDNLPRAVFWKDKDLRIQGCNIIFARVAGMKSPREMIGKTDFDMPWKEHAEAYRADDLSVMNSRQARIDQEERNVNSEGKESWVLTSKVPVLSKDGDVIAVLGMFEDITERKHKDADMKAKMAELERLKKLVESQKN